MIAYLQRVNNILVGTWILAYSPVDNSIEAVFDTTNRTELEVKLDYLGLYQHSFTEVNRDVFDTLIDATSTGDRVKYSWNNVTRSNVTFQGSGTGADFKVDVVAVASQSLSEAYLPTKVNNQLDVNLKEVASATLTSAGVPITTTVPLKVDLVQIADVVLPGAEIPVSAPNELKVNLAQVHGVTLTSDQVAVNLTSVGDQLIGDHQVPVSIQEATTTLDVNIKSTHGIELIDKNVPVGGSFTGSSDVNISSIAGVAVPTLPGQNPTLPVAVHASRYTSGGADQFFPVRGVLETGTNRLHLATATSSMDKATAQCRFDNCTSQGSITTDNWPIGIKHVAPNLTVNNGVNFQPQHGTITQGAVATASVVGRSVVSNFAVPNVAAAVTGTTACPGATLYAPDDANVQKPVAGKTLTTDSTKVVLGQLNHLFNPSSGNTEILPQEGRRISAQPKADATVNEPTDARVLAPIERVASDWMGFSNTINESAGFTTGGEMLVDEDFNRRGIATNSVICGDTTDATCRYIDSVDVNTGDGHYERLRITLI